jgi:hypothetical protein
MYKQSTHQHQTSLAEFCRTGNYQNIPGVNETHVKQYRRLVFNVIDDTLITAYPLTRKLLSHKEWDDLVQEFFSTRNCSNPQIWKMPKELFEFLESKEHVLVEKYPFLLDLLHFEWLEIELYMMEDEPLLAYSTEGDVQEDAFYLNPELQILALQYPVHIKIAKEIITEDEGQYFVAIHRHPSNGKVIFTEINYAHLLLIDLLMQKPSTLSELRSLWLQSLEEKVVGEALLPFVENCLKTKLILGFI